MLLSLLTLLRFAITCVQDLFLKYFYVLPFDKREKERGWLPVKVLDSPRGSDQHLHPELLHHHHHCSPPSNRPMASVTGGQNPI